MNASAPLHSPISDESSRRWIALAAVSLAVLAVGVDGTVLSVALPTLAKVLHASEADLQWFSSGYLLVLAAAMLPAGLLGDRFGRKKVMLISLALFGVGSALCAVSTTVDEFLAARVLMGLSGAGVIVMAVAAIPVLFVEAERPKAVGIWAAANFISFPIGPILGGWLLTNFWWGWVFLLNVPIALIGVVIGVWLMRESRSHDPRGFDLLGIIGSALGLVVLTYGFIQAGEYGWGTFSALGEILAGVVVLVAFFVWERHLSSQPGGHPLLDMSLFASRSYLWGVILAAIGILSLIGGIFTMPQYFQGVVGTNAMGSGVRLLPMIGGLMLGALPASIISKKIGAKLTVALGFLFLAGGLSLGATTSISTGGGFVAMWMAVVGFGVGVAMSTAASVTAVEMTEERSGIGAAVFQAVNKTGGPLGTAVIGSVLNAAYLAHLVVPKGDAHVLAEVRQSVIAGVGVAVHLRSPALLRSVRTSFIIGMDHALVAAACIAVVGLILALAFLPRGTHGTSEATTTGVSS